MVCKEEVFNMFKDLSGAKRIELMCGLMSMCIPLEIRFFEVIIRDLAKKDLNALREAELKANSFQELDQICKCDLLADKAIHDSNDLKANTNCDISSNSLSNNNTVQQSLQSQSLQSIQSIQSSSTPTTIIQDMNTVSANGTNISMVTNNEMIALSSSGMSSPPNSSSNLSLLPARSKLIVSLCLLSPTNRNCSTIAFKALQQQLTAKSIANTVMSCFYRKGCLHFEDLFSEILLLLTMALHHPAFSYEQRNLLAKQKDEVELTIDSINAHLRQNSPNFSSNTHLFQSYHQQQQSHHPSHVSVTQHVHLHQPQVTPVSQTHTHHQLTGVVTHQSQYTTHQFIPVMPYNSAPLQNMSNLRISSLSSPVSTPSPTNSPSSSSKATSVATISPLPINAEFGPHLTHASDSAQNQAPYLLTAGLQTIGPQSMGEDMGCAKSVVSCYNCGNLGHRGDECTAQTQDEANR